MEKDAEGDYSDQTIQYIDDLIYEGGLEHMAFMIMEDDGVAQFSTYEPEPGPENVGEEEYNKQLKIHNGTAGTVIYDWEECCAEILLIMSFSTTPKKTVKNTF